VVAVVLSVIDAACAKATIVEFVVSVTGAVYIGDEPVGADPSVVYLMVARLVPVTMVTVTAFV